MIILLLLGAAVLFALEVYPNICALLTFSAFWLFFVYHVKPLIPHKEMHLPNFLQRKVNTGKPDNLPVTINLFANSVIEKVAEKTLVKHQSEQIKMAPTIEEAAFNDRK
jgi:hypothetical protein